MFDDRLGAGAPMDSKLDRLENLQRLKEKGACTEEEFKHLKYEILHGTDLPYVGPNTDPTPVESTTSEAVGRANVDWREVLEAGSSEAPKKTSSFKKIVGMIAVMWLIGGIIWWLVSPQMAVPDSDEAQWATRDNEQEGFLALYGLWGTESDYTFKCDVNKQSLILGFDGTPDTTGPSVTIKARWGSEFTGEPEYENEGYEIGFLTIPYEHQFITDAIAGRSPLIRTGGTATDGVFSNNVVFQGFLLECRQRIDQKIKDDRDIE